jgi:hypothetical protein
MDTKKMVLALAIQAELFFTLSNLTPCPTYRFQTLGEKNT